MLLISFNVKLMIIFNIFCKENVMFYLELHTLEILTHSNRSREGQKEERKGWVETLWIPLESFSNVSHVQITTRIQLFVVLLKADRRAISYLLKMVGPVITSNGVPYLTVVGSIAGNVMVEREGRKEEKRKEERKGWVEPCESRLTAFQM
jgi:hypothetical protein